MTGPAPPGQLPRQPLRSRRSAPVPGGGPVPPRASINGYSGAAVCRAVVGGGGHQRGPGATSALPGENRGRGAPRGSRCYEHPAGGEPGDGGHRGAPGATSTLPGEGVTDRFLVLRAPCRGGTGVGGTPRGSRCYEHPTRGGENRGRGAPRGSRCYERPDGGGGGNRRGGEGFPGAAPLLLGVEGAPGAWEEVRGAPGASCGWGGKRRGGAPGAGGGGAPREAGLAPPPAGWADPGAQSPPTAMLPVPPPDQSVLAAPGDGRGARPMRARGGVAACRGCRPGRCWGR